MLPSFESLLAAFVIQSHRAFEKNKLCEKEQDHWREMLCIYCISGLLNWVPWTPKGLWWPIEGIHM